MEKHPVLKQFLLKCWFRLAIFLQWVEKHPLIDRIVLLVAKIVIYLLQHR